MTIQKKKYRNKFMMAVIAMLAAFVAVGAATFAWYIYNTNAHTTTVKMAAGTTSSLLISDTYDGEYSYTAAMVPYIGTLANVSTDRIQNGFQICKDFVYGKEGQPYVLASAFDPAPLTDYYKRSLYLKATSEDTKIYVKNIGFKDSSTTDPISSSMRVGLVIYSPGNSNTAENEFIFDINPDQHVSRPEYNTLKGEAGCVLDSTKTDGSVVKFTPLTPANYCTVDGNKVSVDTNSTQIATCSGGGEPIRVDMYLWCEGCDTDCHGYVGNLSEITIEFAGFAAEKS